MKLFYFRSPDGVANFGDELNRYLWPRLLPGAFDRDDGVLFVGIGTLLNDRLPPAPETVIFGAGVGYYGPPRPSDTWDIYCVRGPLSAGALGLSQDLAITDPAALIARFEMPRVRSAGSRYGFMPHWQSEPDAWRDVCADAGLTFVDPRRDPEEVLAALRDVDVLITEAMHGAIVADALRLPWIPVRTREAINAFKWKDWCASMELEYRPRPLPTIWPDVPGAGLLARVRRRAKLMMAAGALARVARHQPPVLSRDAVFRDRLDRLEARLERLKSDRPARHRGAARVASRAVAVE